MSIFERRPVIFTSEQVLCPPVISKEEIENRIKTFSKTDEERIEVKRAKRRVDPTLGSKNFIKFAESNEIGNSNFTIKLYSKI